MQFYLPYDSEVDYFFFFLSTQGHIRFCNNIFEIGDDPLMTYTMTALFLDRCII